MKTLLYNFVYTILYNIANFGNYEKPPIGIHASHASHVKSEESQTGLIQSST